MGTITLNKVRKAFGDAVIIPGADLEIKNGEFVVFVGPSGCGKSTLLRLIAGLEDMTSGEIKIDGADVTNVPPAGRGLAMVFQSYALYPHMSVRKNIAFPLMMAKIDQAEINKKVEKAAETLNLTQYLDRKPGQLSGGQREPLSNLDAALRVNMRIFIMQLHKDLGSTSIYVTHDQVEAMTMADRIVVLNKGNIEQVGSPLELYNKPNSLFVAGFIGSPKMNFVQDNTIGIRPEHIQLNEKKGEWKGTVILSEQLGSDTFLHIDGGALGRLTVRAPGENSISPGSTVWMTPEKSRIHRFDKDGKAIR
jgi:multiple sugar transport system ATP-binding protein